MIKERILSITSRIVPGWIRWKAIDLCVSAANLLKYGDWNFFQHVWIETVTQCNRACPYCPNAVAPIPSRLMTHREFVDVLDALVEIRWSGPVGYHYLSEPLLHPDIVMFIRLTKRALPKSMPILFTNGDFLTIEKASALVEAGLSKCTITRHKPVPYGWDNRINAIIARWPFTFSVSNIDPATLMNMGGMLPGVKTPQIPYCMSPKRVLPIRIDGSIGLCCCDPNGEVSFGSAISPFTSLIDVWKRKPWADVRRNLRRGKRELKICTDCTGAR